MHPTYARALISALRTIEGRTPHPEIRERIANIREAVEQSLRDHPTLLFIQAGDEMSDEEVHAAEMEESFHRDQFDASGPGRHIDAQRFFSGNANALKARSGLAMLRPNVGNPQQQALEIAAMIHNGEWGDLGLSEGEAEAVFYRYARQFYEEHWEKARVIAETAHPAHREAILGRLKQDYPGKFGPGGEAIRGGSDEGDTGDGESGGPILRRPGSGGPGRDGELSSGLEAARRGAEERPGEVTGPHGPIYTEYRHDAQGAIAKLLETRNGEAVAALYHPAVGHIDLIWGDAGANKAKGYGLAKIDRWHPEVIGDLQGILSTLVEDPKHPRNANTVQLENDGYRAAIGLNWKGAPKTWLLTQFDNHEPSTGRRIDVPGTHAAERQAPPPSDPDPSVAGSGDAVNRPKTGDRGSIDPDLLTLGIRKVAQGDVRRIRQRPFVESRIAFRLDQKAQLQLYMLRVDLSSAGTWNIRGRIQHAEADTDRGINDVSLEGGTPERIRTSDLLLRRQALYPAELRARFFHCTQFTPRGPKLISASSPAPVPTPGPPTAGGSNSGCTDDRAAAPRPQMPVRRSRCCCRRKSPRPY